MGIDISPNGVRNRLTEENKNYRQMIEDTNELMNQINQFINTESLKSEAYDSAKAYFSTMHIIILNSMILFADEKQRENNNYLNILNSYFPGDNIVQEDKILDQLRRTSNLIRMIQNNMLVGYIQVLESTEKILNERLEKIYEYTERTKNVYCESEKFLDEIEQGINCMKTVSPNTETGGFNIPPVNMDWATNLNQLEDSKYHRMATEQYGEYLDGNPKEMNKIIEILKYEMLLSSEDIEKINNFLGSLEIRDVVSIKSIAYSAPEPYRGLWVKYLDKYTIVITDGKDGLFKPDEGIIYLNMTNIRSGYRGEYYTFFHECGHAIDYYYGLDDNGRTHFSSTYMDNSNMTLRDYIFADIESELRNSINRILSTSEFDRLSEREKYVLKNAVLQNLTNGGTKELQGDAKMLQDRVVQGYTFELQMISREVASDMIGGVTNNQIKGVASHDDDYWWNPITREPENSINREFFAEIYAYNIIQNERGIDDSNRYLKNSYSHMEKILKEMEN